MKSIMFLFFFLLFNNNAVSQQHIYVDIRLDSLYFRLLSKEIDNYSPFLEFGYFIIDKSDTNSYYIQKKIAEGRFNAENVVVNNKFKDIPRNLVQGNLIALEDISSTSNFHTTRNTHHIKYIKYKGILIVLLNNPGVIINDVDFRTGLDGLDEYLSIIFNIIDIYKER